MHTTFVILSAVVALALAANDIKFTFEKIPLGSAVPQTGKNIITSFPELHHNDTSTIPPDNGGNYGDNIWGQASKTDRPVLGQILINEPHNTDYEWEWKATGNGFYVTEIRFLNIGRERAYVRAITCNDHYNIVANIQMPAKQQFRILIEAYGHGM